MTTEARTIIRAIGRVILLLSIQVLAPVALVVIAAAWLALGLPFSLLHLAVLTAVLCVMGAAFVRPRKAKRHG